MAKLWTVIKREYIERVRSKWFLIGTFIGPLFFGAIMIVPIVLAARTRPSSNVADMTILDATGTRLGERIAETLQKSDSAGRRPPVQAISRAALPAAESLLTGRVVRREVRGYLVLDDPAGVSAADDVVLAGVKARYAGRNASSIADMERVTSAVRQSVLAERLERVGLEPGRIAALTGLRLRLETEQISDRGRGGSGVGAVILGYGVALLLYMMIILYGQNILRGVMEEKTTRVAEVIVSSVKPDTLLAGKVLGVGAVGLTQQIVWILSGILIFKLRAPLMEKLGATQLPFSFPSVAPSTWVVMILCFLLGYIFYAALFAAVGAMVNSQEDAQQAAMPVMVLLIASVIFMQPILLSPASTLAKVMSRLPFSAPILLPLRLSVMQLSWLEIGLILTGLAGACVVAIWVSARIYRVGLLMYGKRPSLRELARWVRYA